jgi:hypothetical protein
LNFGVRLALAIRDFLAIWRCYLLVRPVRPLGA